MRLDPDNPPASESAGVDVDACRPRLLRDDEE
jgi:hypothetical protein